MSDGLTPERARALAQEILERPEYARHRADPSVLQEWIDSFAAWLGSTWDALAGLVPDWVTDIWEAFWSGLGGLVNLLIGSDGSVAVLRLVLAAAVLGAIGILVHRVLREARARAAELPEVEGDASRAGPRLIDEADRHAGEGRFLEAAHCIQLAALQVLLRKKRLELERSDPNRTLRRRLADAPVPATLRDRFLALLDRLEGQWFRDRIDDRDLYGDWRALHAQIEALPERR